MWRNRSKARAVECKPDGELIALCAEFNRLEREFLGSDFDTLPDTPAGDAAWDEQQLIYRAQDPILDRIFSTPFTTLEGAVAVATSLALFTRDDDGKLWADDPEDDYTNWRLQRALMRGLIGGRTSV